MADKNKINELVKRRFTHDTMREILSEGGILYGETPDDVSHIEYAAGLAIDTVKHLYDGDMSVLVMLEIGIDENGLYVAYPLNNALDESDQ